MSTRTEDPQAPLAPRQSEPGIVTGESGTCVVSVVFANELEVTLNKPDLQVMAGRITGLCHQQNGRLAATGGSFGLNARMTIDVVPPYLNI